MLRRTPLALLAAFLLSAPGLAQTARPSADDLIGTWTRRADGHEITATFGPDGLRLSVAMPEGVTLAMDADYLVTRDGILVGVLRLRNGDFLRKKMELGERFFYCRFALEEDELVVREVEAANMVDERSKKVIEGRYRRGEVPKAISSSSIGATKTPLRARRDAPASGKAGASSLPSWGSILGAVVDRLLADTPVFNTYSSDPNQRIREMINSLEAPCWTNWSTGQPSHLTSERIHGGIQ